MLARDLFPDDSRLSFLSFIGFFAAIAYHTPYAQPWIYPPVAFYTFDLFMRLFKCRVKDAFLVPVPGMTMVGLSFYLSRPVHRSDSS